MLGRRIENIAASVANRNKLGMRRNYLNRQRIAAWCPCTETDVSAPVPIIIVHYFGRPSGTNADAARGICGNVFNPVFICIASLAKVT
jgi:hypothetical protein